MVDERHARRLGHEWNRSRGARVRLDHMELTGGERELHV